MARNQKEPLFSWNMLFIVTFLSLHGTRNKMAREYRRRNRYATLQHAFKVSPSEKTYKLGVNASTPPNTTYKSEPSEGHNETVKTAFIRNEIKLGTNHRNTSMKLLNLA